MDGIRQELERIPEVFKAETFSPAAFITDIILKGDIDRQRTNLQAYSAALDAAREKIINEYYGGFNKSVQNFSKILRIISVSQERVEKLEKDLKVIKSKLASRGGDLSQLWSQTREYGRTIELLKEIEELQTITSRVDDLIATGDYTLAVKQLVSHLELVHSGLQDVPALQDFITELRSRKSDLYEILLTLIHDHVYLKTKLGTEDATSAVEGSFPMWCQAAVQGSTSTGGIDVVHGTGRAMIVQGSQGSGSVLAEEVASLVGAAQLTMFRPCAAQTDKERQRRQQQLIKERNVHARVNGASGPAVSGAAGMDSGSNKANLRRTSLAAIQDESRATILKHAVDSLDRLGQLEDALDSCRNNIQNELKGVIGEAKRTWFGARKHRQMLQRLSQRQSTVARHRRKGRRGPHGPHGTPPTPVHSGGHSSGHSARGSGDGGSGKAFPNPARDLTRTAELSASLHDSPFAYSVTTSTSGLGLATGSAGGGTGKLGRHGHRRARHTAMDIDLTEVPQYLFLGFLREIFHYFRLILHNHLTLLNCVHKLPSVDSLANSLYTTSDVWQCMQLEVQILLCQFMNVPVPKSGLSFSASSPYVAPRNGIGNPTDHLFSFSDSAAAGLSRLRRAQQDETKKGSGAGGGSTTSTRLSVSHAATVSGSASRPLPFPCSPYNAPLVRAPIADFVASIADVVGQETAAGTAANQGLTGALPAFLDETVAHTLIPQAQHEYGARLRRVLEGTDAFAARELPRDLQAALSSGEVLGAHISRSSVRTSRTPGQTPHYNTSGGRTTISTSTGAAATGAGASAGGGGVDGSASHARAVASYTDPCEPMSSASETLAMVHELMGAAASMPSFTSDIILVVEDLLLRYLERCEERTQQASADSYAAEQLASPHTPALLMTDPLFKALRGSGGHRYHRRGSIGSNTTDSDSDDSGDYERAHKAAQQFAEAQRQLDAKLYARSKWSRSRVITDRGKLVLLASLAVSLEWLADRLYSLADTGIPCAGGMYLRPPFSEVHVQSLDRVANKFRFAADLALITLRLDLRSHCFYFLDGIQKSDYAPSSPTTELEPFILAINRDLSRFEDAVAPLLSARKKAYLFNPLPQLLSDILIHSVTKLGKINEHGVTKMCRNVFALQQNLLTMITVGRSSSRSGRVKGSGGSGDHMGEEHTAYAFSHPFDRVRQYYNLLLFSEEALLAYVGDHRTHFRPHEYENLFKAVTHLRERASPDSLDLLQSLLPLS